MHADLRQVADFYFALCDHERWTNYHRPIHATRETLINLTDKRAELKGCQVKILYADQTTQHLVTILQLAFIHNNNKI